MRGPGFDKLRELADVVYDPWIDKTPLRIYTAEQLAERARSRRRRCPCGGDPIRCSGPVFELPLRAIASTRGDPNNVDISGATAAGIPVLHTPGRNADAVAEMAVALLFAATRHLLTADADVRSGQVFRDGTIPYQRFRARRDRGANGRPGRSRRRRPGASVAAGRAGRFNVIAHDPYNDEASHSLDELLEAADIVSLHAPVTEDTVGMIGARQFAAMRDGVVFINTAARPAARHRRAGRRADERQGRRRGP